MQEAAARARKLARLVVPLIATLAAAAPAKAEDIRVFSGGAPQETLQALAPAFEKQTGHRLRFTFAHVSIIRKKLEAGEQTDVVLLPVQLIAATEKTVALRAEGRSVLARIGIGVVIPEGGKRPDLATVDAVRRMLVEARAIAVPRPEGITGSHLMRMMSRLGIADEVRAKLRHQAAVERGAEQVAKGVADVGLYLASEVQGVKGTVLAGMLPAELQNYVVYGVAVPAHNTRPEAALAFVRFISDAASAGHWKATGFELIERKI